MWLYRGNVSSVSLAAEISSGAPKVCTAVITTSRDAAGMPSSCVSIGNRPTKSLSNASVIKAKPASMPVYLMKLTIAQAENYMKQTLRRKALHFLKL